METSYLKDILRTIQKSAKRFFAIMAITALGFTSFVGIYAACRDMYRAADRFYDAQKLFDIQVLSTLALVEEDVAALQGVAGVELVDGAYVEKVYTMAGDLRHTASMHMLSAQGINKPYVLAGRLPQRAGEIAVTEKYLHVTGKRIGDEIEIEEEIEEASDATEDAIETKKEEPNFLNTTYTITGAVLNPMAINNSEGTSAFRSASTTDYTFFVTPEDVDTDIFTSVYIRLHGLSEFECYSAEYKEAVQHVIDWIETEILEQREQARYREVMMDALESITDAEITMQQQFDDAQIQFDEAWMELEKARLDILDGEAQLSSRESEALRAIEDAREEISQGRRQIAQTEQQLAQALLAIQAGQMEYEAGLAAYNAGEAQYQANRASIENLAAGIGNVPSALSGMRLLLDIYGSDLSREPIAIMQFQQAATGLISILDGLTSLFASAGQTDMVSMLYGVSGGIQSRLNMAGIMADYESVYAAASSLQASVGGMTPYAAMQAAVENARAQLITARAELDAAAMQLSDAKATLDNGRIDHQSGVARLQEARAELDQGEAQLLMEEADALRNLTQAKQSLVDGKGDIVVLEATLLANEQQYREEKAKAQQALDDAYSELNDIDMTQWYVQSRTLLDSYSGLDSDLTSINVIGKAFPVLFLVVAVLTSLTTMTRMVEEERSLIGTYKAQGFSDGAIVMKYMIYALFASIAGSMLGVALGFIMMPKLLITVLDVIYTIPDIRTELDIVYGIRGALLFMVSIVCATVLSCRSELRQTPAALMRPKTPRAGSRIFLERIPAIWSRLNFLNKVTARNLFRYKKRMFMTIIGIAGCTALVLMGFAIRDSVNEMLPLQYEKIYCYDMMVTVDAEDCDKLEKRLLADKEVSEYILAKIERVKILNAQGDSETIQLIAIPDGARLENYIATPDVGGTHASLDDDAILLTQNVAELLNIAPGESVTLQNLNLERRDVAIGSVVENYIGNNVFLSQTLYEVLFGDYAPNGAYLHLRDTVMDHTAYADALLDEAYVTSTFSVLDMKATFSKEFEIINIVIYALIVLAAGLAFVVLFTLATTNISERERELATIKVLGFFEREVHAYVNKETIILTIIGVLAGLPLGYVCTGLLLSALKMPSLVFVLMIQPPSYGISAVISFSFALIVNQITNRMLDKINMVEALKSIE